MDDFRLLNDEPHVPWSAPLPVKRHQGVLFSGLDCLPGQLDLFCTDGDRQTTEDAGDTER